jgi:hypothetical protein
MPWKQIKPFDQSKAGKEKLMCLKNTRLGYGIDKKCTNATDAWNHTRQHRDRNVPLGVDVPLFYYFKTSKGNEGHINVRLANGKVWSDGEIFANIADYEAKRVPDFIGWGESVNDVRVIEYANEPQPVEQGTKLPLVGSRIQLIPRDTRTTFRAGTSTEAGKINVTDNTFEYTVHGHDPKFPNRIIINSASAGGDGVSLALYYLDGRIIPGWKVI